MKGTGGSGTCVRRTCRSDQNPTHIPLLLRVEMKRQTMIETFEVQDPAAAAEALQQLVELNSVRASSCMRRKLRLEPSSLSDMG